MKLGFPILTRKMQLFESNSDKAEEQIHDAEEHSIDLKDAGLFASHIANELERTQVGKFHTKGGHGFAAEDANALADKVRLRKVDITGKNNSLNGPDRIVDNIAIQTKYCQTPTQTVGSAFDSQTGLYRYKNQLLEVPCDQYEECLRLMREKISQGKVPGISDSGDAERIIKKGTVTYKQARNIARAGNIDSLVYDAKTQAISTSYVFATSFAIQFARGIWNGQSKEVALKEALNTSMGVSSASFITGIIASQILRTRMAAMGTVAVRRMLKGATSTQLGKTTVEKLATVSLGKAIYGAAALNHVSKLLRSNIITSVVVTIVVLTPDLYRVMVSKRMSRKQFGKNLVVNVSGVVAGLLGWIAGSIVGGIIGSAVPVIGTAMLGSIGGVIGAFVIGMPASLIVQYILDKFFTDDAKHMLYLANRALEEVAFDFLLISKEVDEFLGEVKKVLKTNWLRDMYQAGAMGDSDEKRQAFAYEAFEKKCQEIVAKRPKVFLPNPPQVGRQIDEIVKKVIEDVELNSRLQLGPLKRLK